MPESPWTDLIDVHAHFVPPSYLRALAAGGITEPDGFPHIPEWTAATAIERMDELGIGVEMLSISSPGIDFAGAETPALARAVNEEGAAAVNVYPARFGLLASLPLPDVEASLAEIDHAFDELGADGAGVMSNAAGVYLGDARLDPVMAELDRRGAVLVIHPTSPPGWEQVALGRPRPMIEFIFDTTRAIFNLILGGATTRFPNVKIVVPHTGSAIALLADRVTAFTAAFGQLGSLDVDAELARFYYDLAGTSQPRSLPALLSVAEADRLLYGSDLPFAPPGLVARLAADLASAEELGTDPAGLLRRNALGLFPRLEAARR